MMTYVVAALAIVFLVWRIAERWKGASDYSEAMAAEERQQREDFEALKGHPALQRVWQQATGRYGITFEATPAPGQYRVRFLSLYSQAQAVRAYDPNGRYLNVYLQREEAPKYLCVSVDLATGQVVEHPFTWFQWSASIPNGF